MSILDRTISFTFTLRQVLHGSLWFYGVVLMFGLSTHYLFPGPRDHGPFGHALGLIGVAVWLLLIAEPAERQEGENDAT